MGSVWLKEVEIALRNKLRKIVHLEDEDTGDNLVKVLVLKPEKEIDTLQYPCVTIFNSDIRFDGKRFDRTEVVKVTNTDTCEGTIEEQARPYQLSYQISFWAESLSDINEMTRMWLEKVEKFSILNCVDTEGIERKCHMSLVKQFNEDNTDSSSKRIFRRIYLYNVWVELDNPDIEEVQLVRSVEYRRRER